MNKAYSLEIRKQAKMAAKEVGIENIIREGVYAIVGGPNYETVAECRLLHQLGVDAVGEYIIFQRFINLKKYC